MRTQSVAAVRKHAHLNIYIYIVSYYFKVYYSQSSYILPKYKYVDGATKH